MTETEGYRSSHVGRGDAYHGEFARNPRRAFMWKMERAALDDIVSREFGGQGFRHLDFACGTGRIIGHLESRAQDSIGVDVSASMLEVARRQVRRARLLQLDITGDQALVQESFDLITAFRFFPNAEAALRDSAMHALSARMSARGRLVFNNHCHAGGLNRRVMRRIRGASLKLNDMTYAECEELVARHGLRIERVYHVGVLPDYETRLLKPRFAVEALERVACRLPLRHIAENLIFVCRPASAAC